MIDEDNIPEDWYKSPPKSLEECLIIFNARMGFLQDKTPEGAALRRLYKRIQREAEDLSKKARASNPLAFVKLSYEQALKINSWIWGISFKIDFDANRVGKTATSIFDALLWMIPNDPKWMMFQPYTDKFGRYVKVFQRPSMESVLKISNLLRKEPQLRGNPLKQPYDEENKQQFAILQKRLQNNYQPAFPLPSFSEPEHILWHGAPDADYHKNIIMKEWRKWFPKSIMERDSEYDRTFDLNIQHEQGESHWKIVCKSYEAADTKWSGAAVTGVLLTEGLKEATLNEIKQRFRNDAFGYWDYTPYEPRNVGIKTALAHRVFKGKVPLPLSPFVFSGFGIEKTPNFILPEEKRNDLIRMWSGKAEGEARIHGKFYTSSPVVLTNFDIDFHTVSWTKEELFNKFPSSNLYRGLDPGFDHPTACALGLLAPNNVWYIYGVYSKAGTSIPQRCAEIITFCNNARRKKTWGSGPEDYYYEEYHPNNNSQEIISTIADYHTFKADEITRQSYSLNYVREGLIITPSITLGPRERAQTFDRMLSPDLTRPHPQTNRPPGARIYFLINEEGVADALEKIQNIFWDRYRTGDKAGEPKDQIQEHDDDEFDAISYLVCSPVRYTKISNLRKEEIEKGMIMKQKYRPRQLTAFAVTG